MRPIDLSLALVLPLVLEAPAQVRPPSMAANLHLSGFRVASRISQDDTCPASDTAPVLITRDSVGGLGLWQPLGELKRQYHGMPAKMPVEAGSNARPAEALEFHVHCLHLTATQNRNPIDLSTPAEKWIVEGRFGVLPNGISTTSTWPQLQKAYKGPVGVGAPGSGFVFFCLSPDFSFHLLDAGDEVYDSQDAKDISQRAKVGDVVIFKERASC